MAAPGLESSTVVSRKRKGRALTTGRFGCLEGIPTINVTNGCLFRCTYCYARGYSQAPERGEVHLYWNLPRLLDEELSRKKRLPLWVILNTASDCFQPHPDILETTYQVIQILLNHGVGVSFLTKGIIPHRFYDLFAPFREKIAAQIGLVSFSERYWKSFEPKTPSPVERMENIRKLQAIGIPPEVRVDPIIPFVTDREDEVAHFFERLSRLGVKRVTLSYLHLRPAIEQQLKSELPPLYQKILEACFRTQTWRIVGSSTKTKLLPSAIRRRGYERIKEIAHRAGIKAMVCQCKNPDLEGDLCSSGKTWSATRKYVSSQLPLFRC